MRPGFDAETSLQRTRFDADAAEGGELWPISLISKHLAW
jgi:hypothetical protein